MIPSIFRLRERCRRLCRDEGVGRRFVALTSIAYELIPEGKFVAEDIQAGDAILAFLIVPLTLAALLATGDFAFAGNRAGELDAEVKVAANAFPIRTIETENGFGVVEIGFVFHPAVAGDAFGVEVLEVDGE